MIWIYGILFCLALAKWMEWDSLANVSWWWILAPLFALVAWFEIFERLFGFDSKRKLEDATFERAKRERIQNQLKAKRTPGKR